MAALDIETGLVRWSVVLDENITAAPVVAGGTVVIGTENGVVHGIDAHTGELAWDFRIDGKITDSPIIAGGVIYVASDNGKLYAVAGAGP